LWKEFFPADWSNAKTEFKINVLLWLTQLPVKNYTFVASGSEKLQRWKHLRRHSAVPAFLPDFWLTFSETFGWRQWNCWSRLLVEVQCLVDVQWNLDCLAGNRMMIHRNLKKDTCWVPFQKMSCLVQETTRRKHDFWQWKMTACEFLILESNLQNAVVAEIFKRNFMWSYNCASFCLRAFDFVLYSIMFWHCTTHFPNICFPTCYYHNILESTRWMTG